MIKATIVAFLLNLLFQQVTFSNDSTGEVDISPFFDKGCRRSIRLGTGKRYLDCSPIKLETRFGCFEIREAPSSIVGLKPEIPIVTCFFEKTEDSSDSEDSGWYEGCGLLNLYRKYIVHSESDFQEVATAEKFRKFFAPVDSEREALSFALALTRSHPLKEIEMPDGYIAEVQLASIQPTYVKADKDGFIVRLFDYECGGCELHYYYSIDYLVSTTGVVEERSRQNLYRNPAEDNRCQD